MCIGIIWNNSSLVCGRAAACPGWGSNPGHWACHAPPHMAAECLDHSATRAGIAISQKRYKTEAWFLLKPNSKSYALYRIALTSNSSLFTPALLRTHSFVFFAVHETAESFSALSSQRCQDVFRRTFMQHLKRYQLTVHHAVPLR